MIEKKKPYKMADGTVRMKHWNYYDKNWGFLGDVIMSKHKNGYTVSYSAKYPILMSGSEFFSKEEDALTNFKRLTRKN